MSRNVPGTTYLLHLLPAFKHAKHYVGFAEGDEKQLQERLSQHGGPQGARLLAAQKYAGGTWKLVRTWPNTTRAFERHLKNTRQVPAYCPVDQPEIAARKRELRAKEKAMKEIEEQPEWARSHVSQLGEAQAAEYLGKLDKRTKLYRAEHEAAEGIWGREPSADPVRLDPKHYVLPGPEIQDVEIGEIGA